jgi:hypothetical protein
MEISKRNWRVVFALVLLAHLVLLVLLEGLLGQVFSTPERQSPLSVRLVAPPPALPVLPRSESARPVGPAPAVGPVEIPVNESLVTQESTAATELAANRAAVEEFFDSSLEPAQSLAMTSDGALSGGAVMTAYWGDFAAGSPIGQSVIELSFPAPDRYEVKMVTEAQGWARLFASAPMLAEARGRLGPGGFMPERYAHQGPRRSEVTVFDYEKSEVRYESLKEPLPLLTGIQDRLTFMLQLAWMLQAQPDRFGLGQTVSLPLAGRNKVEEVDFVVLSDADLALPGGKVVPALHLSSNRSTSRYSVQIDIWMDRTDRLLPVRIRFEEARGTVLDLLTVRN